MTNAVSIAQLGSNNSTMRNRIINGAMVIDQRNAGASVTPADGAYTLDRWNYNATQASKMSVQRSTTAPVGFSNSMLVTTTTAVSVGAGDTFSTIQAIEGFNFADCAWGTADAKTVTLSFWVRSSLTGTFGGALLNSAQNRSYPFTYTISSANTFEYKTVTIAGDTTGTWIGATNGVGVRVCFDLGTGSTYAGTAGAWTASGKYAATGSVSVVGTNGATFYITGVQLEVGSTATSFDYRNYGTELALCQRYFQVYGNSSAEGVAIPTQSTASAGEWDGYMTLPTVMRSTPTATISNLQISDGNTARINATTIAVYQTSTYNGCGIFGCYMTVSGATQYRPYLLCTSSAGGYLRLSSEL